jgi:hypothetical protein
MIWRNGARNNNYNSAYCKKRSLSVKSVCLRKYLPSLDCRRARVYNGRKGFSLNH